jgi:hypothetical protein
MNIRRSAQVMISTLTSPRTGFAQMEPEEQKPDSGTAKIPRSMRGTYTRGHSQSKGEIVHLLPNRRSRSGRGERSNAIGVTGIRPPAAPRLASSSPCPTTVTQPWPESSDWPGTAIERTSEMTEWRRTGPQRSLSLHASDYQPPHSYLFHLHVHEAWRCNGVRYVCPGRTMTRARLRNKIARQVVRLGFQRIA